MFKFLKKNNDAKQATELSGIVIKYSTERVDDMEIVVGKAGSLMVREDTFFIYSSVDTVFSTKLCDIKVSFLMSGDGAIISGPDLTHGGTYRSVIVHFTYYRK